MTGIATLILVTSRIWRVLRALEFHKINIIVNQIINKCKLVIKIKEMQSNSNEIIALETIRMRCTATETTNREESLPLLPPSHRKLPCERNCFSHVKC